MPIIIGWYNGGTRNVEIGNKEHDREVKNEGISNEEMSFWRWRAQVFMIGASSLFSWSMSFGTFTSV